MADQSFGAAWTATLAFLRDNISTLLPVGAAFLFLPQLLFQFSTQGVVPGDDMSGQEAVSFLLKLVALMLASVVGQVTITKLAIGRNDESTVGSAIAASLAIFVPVVVATMLQSVAVFIGTLLFIVPGLYLIGRLLFTMPVMADGENGPLTALKRSWALTDGNGFRLLAYLLVLILGFVAVTLLLGGLGAAVGVITTVAAGKPAEGWGIGRWLFELFTSGVGALLSMCYIVFIAMLYRAFSRP